MSANATGTKPKLGGAKRARVDLGGANLIDQIRTLLGSDAHERQIAAAIVLGELGAKNAAAVDVAVIDALVAAATTAIPPVQRHALEAVAALAGHDVARTALPAIVPLLGAREESVRRAAVDAIVAFGDHAVAPVRHRLAAATDPAERRALEEILGRIGGKDAFVALLAALDTPDADAARAAALAVRQRTKTASTRERASYLATVSKLLIPAMARGKSGGPARANLPSPSPTLTAGALKILGYLEDPTAVPMLLEFACDTRQPAIVREEAVVALRFTARGKPGHRVALPLLDLAERAPPDLARTALYTLASLDLPPTVIPRLRKLALAENSERALLAIERLSHLPEPAAGNALADVLAATNNRGRAESAATALGDRKDGPAALARALLAIDDSERLALLARLLRPRARELAGTAPGKRLATKLIDHAVAKAMVGGGATDALMSLAREIDREATARALREVAIKLQRRRDNGRIVEILRLIARAPDATPEDGYALASAELRAGRREEALIIFEQLVQRRFDVAAAIRRDRALTPEERYHVGFALVEHRNPAGEEVLADVAKGSRGKIAKMAMAKLALGNMVPTNTKTNTKMKTKMKTKTKTRSSSAGQV